MRRVTYIGTLELRPFGDTGQPSIFLGGEIPLVAAIQREVSRYGGHFMEVDATIEGCAPKRAAGFAVVCAQLIGTMKGIEVIERLEVDGRDIAALLRAAVGRRARIRVGLSIEKGD